MVLFCQYRSLVLSGVWQTPFQVPVSDKQTQKTDEDLDWQPDAQVAHKPRAPSKKRSQTKKATAKNEASKKKSSETGSAQTDAQVPTDESVQNLETTEVIVIQTKKKPKKWKEMKECEICLKKLPSNSALTSEQMTCYLPLLFFRPHCHP